MGKKNKILTLIVSLALIVTLIAGCGSNTSSSTSSNTSKDEPVTITYSAGKDSTPATQKLIEAFEKKYPNIKVKFQELPNSTDDQHNSYVTALSAGDSSIDVLAMDIIWTPEFAAADWLLPLDDKFTEEMREKFLPGPVEAVTYNGHVWAVPRFTDAGVLYYRKDIIDTPPKTWDELIQMSKENVGKGGTKYGIVFQGNQYEGLVCDALELIGSNGGSVLEGDKVTINTPQAVAGLQYLIDLVKIAPPGVTTYQEEEARNVFQQGEAIFMRNWPYAWSLVNGDDSPIKGKVGIAPIPKGKNGQAGTPVLGGWNLGINKYSKHPEEAWKFIEFVTSEEGQKITALEGGNLPTIKSLYQDEEVLAKNPYWADFYDAFITAKPRPVSPFYPQMSDSMQINFHKALTGEITAQQAIQNIEKDLNDIIKNEGKK
ncbi:extracellular solute-binding protein family 1 [Thermoanaerobacter mathranii subsp. mathranii str. A3]|uniref:Multiple sugar transport system substrate-binding protein n=2 Tax=Thermoanaerobacter TaxID=1754 RepID=A0ABT9M309_9THEO|nr:MULTISPECIES: ABC transporter substrate-binding protein [Thermoanaerobacter]ADH60265.1 extracellular solute-binding protein family 1 [Thermoanaerobacter mathranii subsp. mathranii str. A3]MDP9750507.1 multiple sugar transport system substrate-binding protein [Thermoanaerobacter pentosaceus]